MKREDLEKLWPILEAYRQGKTIEVYDSYKDTWCKINNPAFDSDPDHYRIAAEPKYRPFQNSEECWGEMKKHRPFGWIKSSMGTLFNILEIGNSLIVLARYGTSVYDEAIKDFVFVDGTPFGKKEE